MGKRSGIGAVYSSTTGSIVSAFDTVNTLCTAGRILAQNAESQAMISRIESSKTLLEAMGDGGAEKLAEAAALMETLRNM